MCILFSIGMLMDTSCLLAWIQLYAFTLHPVSARVPTRRRANQSRPLALFFKPTAQKTNGTFKSRPGSNIAVLLLICDMQ
jgi:hypothetical protein